jgi:hypothetical protein
MTGQDDERAEADFAWLMGVLWNQPDPELEEFRKLDREGQAIVAAELGNLDALREMFPRHAKFINEPKEWMRGKHRPKVKWDPHSDYLRRVREAYADAKRIRALAKEYKRELTRPANWYAARFWGLDEWEVAEFRPSGKKDGRASSA